MNLHAVRLALIFFLIGGGILMHLQTGLTPAWYFYLTAVILLFTHFRFGNIWAAFSALRQGRADEAELMLKKNPKPAWLAKSPRAYYHFTSGMIELQKKELESAQKHLMQAHKLGLRTPNDKALCALNLAHIYLVKEQKETAKEFLALAKSFDPNDLMIKDNIKKMEKVV